MKNKENRIILIAGLIFGAIAVILTHLGNPPNMGMCIVCFWRDIAGAVGLHRAPVVQYIRPEILGLILGAFGLSFVRKEFRPRGGSQAAIRFTYGFFMAIAGLVFLGCPIRMILRLVGGDLNAITGLIGFIVGILIALQFLKNGYSLGRNHKESSASGLLLPSIAIILLILLLVAPSFIFFSEEGPGSMTAPIFISLGFGIIIGVLLQYSRICTAGSFRDLFLIKNSHFFFGIIGIFISALIGNLILGNFNPGFTGQPIAHSDHLFNFLSMLLTGLCATFAGGCPMRQTVLASEGDGDAFMNIIGIIVGAAFAHNFGIAASADGVPFAGKVATIFGIVVILSIATSITYKLRKDLT